ncbi:hypothetical protein TRAPUB_5004 [Trametes pubescens]|uniref:Uncharacterized protein n=1 Tax=Trametes pubescens TaxID=154538 RepID=A0A1M2V9C7_TRAPU|nr:hypothetical protein TRAPUB_5004 [Trametes pubescens]
MSDDEDEGETDENKNRSAPVSPPTSGPSETSLLDVLHEEEDVVVPTGKSRKRVSSTPALRKTRSRRGTIESLLSPLTNFIDFRDDEGSSRSWRSFVEIS